MRLSQFKDAIHKFLEKEFYDPYYKGEYRPDFNIIPLRFLIFFALVIYFHLLSPLPLEEGILGRLIVLEIVYGVYAILVFFFSKRKVTVELQASKLILDLLFVSLFEYISLSMYGGHSGLYVLFITPVLFCAYWFRLFVTIIYINVTAAIFCLINLKELSLVDRFDTSLEVFRVLGPVVVLLYIVGLGGHYYKRLIQRSQDEKKKRYLLEYTREFSHSLLENQFDAIIEVDENGLILDANERAYKMLGYEPEELSHTRVENIYAEGEARRVMTELRKRENGTLLNFETVALKKEKIEIPILLSATFLADKLTLKQDLSQDKKFKTVGFFKDIRAEIAIDKITRGSLPSSTEEEFLMGVAQRIASTFNVESCSIIKYEDKISKLKTISNFGVPAPLIEEFQKEEYDLDEGYIGRCYNIKESVCQNNFYIEGESLGDNVIENEFLEKFSQHSRFGKLEHLLFTPLLYRNELYGIIRLINKQGVDRKLDPDGFNLFDVKLLERVSRKLSDYAQRIKDIERNDRLQKAGESLNEMMASRPENILAKIPEYVVNVMGYKACYLRLLEEGNLLRIKAAYGFKGTYLGKEQYDLFTGSDSITANAVREGDSIIIEDIMSAEKYPYLTIAENEGLKSMLSMPMKYRGHIIGVINCYTGTTHRFSDVEKTIIKGFAQSATIAIQNKRRIDVLRALNEIGGELVKPIKLEELIKLILKNAKSLSGADRVCIKMYDESKQIITTPYSVGCPWHQKYPNEVVTSWVEYGNKDALEVYNSGKSKIVPNHTEIIGRTRELSSPELMGSIKSCALVPVTVDQKVYGVIFLESDRSDFFTEDDLLILEAFSSQAAIAIKNADFVNKLQQVTESFPSISKLDIDIDKILENIAGVARQILDADVLVIFEYDEKNNKVIAPPIVSGILNRPEFMNLPMGKSDAPYLFIQRENPHGYYYFADNIAGDPVMKLTMKPRDNIEVRFLEREGIKSSAVILLKAGGETVGVMFVNYRKKHPFDADEQKIFLNYASYIAIAIKNVRHFKAKEALTALDSVQKLAASLAHKMKNDIGAIRLNTDRLVNRIKPSSSGHEILVDINRVLGKTVADIEALLRASYLHEQDIQPLDFLKYLRKLESEEIAPDLKVKGIELKTEISGNIPELRFDPLQIKMVFSNLVHNSINAMPHGGKVFLSVIKESRDVIIYWWDSGPGVAVENASKIFEPYWSTKGKGSGFGIGLFLSKRVIEEHGGTMELDIENKIGAKFVIKLPVKESIHDRGRN